MPEALDLMYAACLAIGVGGLAGLAIVWFRTVTAVRAPVVYPPLPMPFTVIPLHRDRPYDWARDGE